MAAKATPASAKDLRKRLDQLRDVPVNTEGCSDSVLAPIFSYLINVSPRPDGTLHWFCDLADQVTVDAATFLLRLFAYNSPNVEQWKTKLVSCLSTCAKCVQGLEVNKLSSRHTYFGAFSDDVLKGFYLSFSKWELDTVLRALTKAGISPGASATGRTLFDAPPAVVYHMISNLSILQDPRIVSIVHSYTPPEPLSGWPPDPPPPGLLALMMDESSEVRRWAKGHSLKCTEMPIPRNKFTHPHETVLDMLSRIMMAIGYGDTQSPVSNSSMKLPIASDPIDLWPGFSSVLRLVPPELLTSSSQNNIDVRRIVTGHLHDIGPQFVDILRCFLLLMKRIGKNIWQGEGPEFPQVTFDAIKDNPSYAELLLRIDPAGERPWFFAWFADYLQTIQDQAVYSDVLAKMIDFMCEELQHERFQEIRPVIMIGAMSLLSTILRKSQGDDKLPRRLAVLNVLDIHSDMFTAVAFSRSYSDSNWKDARTAVRELIKNALLSDVVNISATVDNLCRVLAGHKTPVLIPTVQSQMWKKAYDSVQTDDPDGLAMLLRVVAQSSHLDILEKKAFSPAFEKAGVQTDTDPDLIQKAFEEVNRSLVTIRSGALETISKYANYNVSTSLLDLLRRPGVVKDLTVLMLSPVENLQVAAQTLVGQAFDVDVRLDCFRALLSNMPDAALDGIFGFLDEFVLFAPRVPEACSLSKSLVRCLTDVIEVLCAGRDGLLHSNDFLGSKDKTGPAAQLPKLWNLMSQAITVIFRRTPMWSTYFENEDMVVWMRDALIFGRDMLAQRRVIETAASSVADSSVTKRGKLSLVGKKMVNDLQQVLLELSRWLRLTDEELLHQSFALLQTLLDCFRESEIQPNPAAIAKLQKHIDDARKQVPSNRQTRLDSARLSKLEDALSSFEDDVQIISHTIPEPPSKVKETKGVTNQLPKPSKKLIATDLRKSAVKPAKEGSLQPPKVAPRFTDQDQKKLDAATSMPTFRRSVASTSTKLSVSSIVSKNEAKSLRSPVSDSSESDESDSEEESQVGLATLNKFQKSPKVRKQERRQVKLLDVPIKKNAIQTRLDQREDARRTALRLKPDVSDLHRSLLSWNYEHTGSDPPGKKLPLTHVPDRFSDYDQYRRTFEPLLLLECWSQIAQSKEESQEIYQCTISSRQFISDWLDLDFTISETVKKEWYLAETDVVLLRNPATNKSILAKVQSYRPTFRSIEGTLRCYIQGGVDPGLQINTSWKLSKVLSLSTLHREYAALLALPYYDLNGIVLNPQLSKITVNDTTEIKQVMSSYKVNEPQAIAIISSLRTEGFALIQGPPGTGKTSTICGLVEAFLLKRPRPVTAVNVGRQAEKSAPKKILLCAPSNAAIDEVASRIKEGLRGVGRDSAPKVVRVGADKAINISVKDVSLDFLVEQKLNQDPKSSTRDAGGEIAALRTELESVRRLKQQKLEELSTVRDNTARTMALEDEIKKLNTRRMALTQQFDRLKDKQKSDFRTLDATRRKFRAEVLFEADVICSTLSGSGHEILEQFDFEMVVIDEAAQAIELSSLIPLKYRCKTCVMVGDPQQLPPTVLSQEACKFQYNQSLFVRLQKHKPDAVHLLSIQYRMHPDISQLPSRVFYQGRLQDGPGMAAKTMQPWHTSEKFGTYRFFNISRGQEEQGRNHSLKNVAECQVAVALYARLCREFEHVDLDFRVGVVSMYRAQIQELRRAFEQRFGSDIIGRVDFNTVDGFQGQEKDIIILSCVRAGPGVQSVGFLADTRRMNVALTRARSSLFVLGNAPTLERSDAVWKDIVRDARTRGSLVDADVGYFTSSVNQKPRPPPLTKANKLPVPPPEIPADLTTPLGLSKAVKAKEQPRSRTQDVSESNEQPQVIGQKRPMDNDDNDKLSHDPQLAQATFVDPQPPRIPTKPNNAGRPAMPAITKPKLPPAKRQKQSANIFIPKRK